MAVPFPPPNPPPPVVSDFVPKAYTISNISNANPCVITTTIQNNYMPGLIVRIDIPYPNCMPLLNGQFGPITIISPTSFSIPVDTTNFGTFNTGPTITVYPEPPAVPFDVPSQVPQAIPIAEVTQTLINAVNNIAPA